ncbi:hypothetical protein KSF_048520 [Reticulibacter mediterranei]|uniref:Helicase HerA central domain-containing protein n=1 Tax=Reticulibacter mediterranei TaxID=2778369 RepID=A0A8J3INH9_9CHLR|nr:hypothetical protein [Reticulibacter mediterranei]GHO94804.1 hypothetical protein KSF_048520 [Reticulibacter mediterranei]
MEDQRQLPTAPDQIGEPALPIWQRITKGQVIVTSAALVASGAADVAMHFDKTGMFFGLLAVGAIARHSDEIAKWLVPGSGAETHARLVEATQHVVNTVSPATPMVYVDQSAQAKLKRLFGFRSEKTAGLYLQTPSTAPVPPQQSALATSAASIQPSSEITSTSQGRAWRKGALKWGESVRFGRRFDPQFNSVFGRGLLITGTQGAGKTNLIGSTILSAARNNVPCLLVDVKDEYYPLREKHQTIISCGHPDYADEAGTPYYSVTPENAEEFAHDLMEYGAQAIFNVQSYADANEMAETLALILPALIDWSRGLDNEEERPPCLIVTDEAHNLVPEQPALSALPISKPNFQHLKTAYSMIANMGRSYGYTLVMATQRLANISKASIANLNIQIIMKQDLDKDIERCEDYIGKELCKQLRDLPTGQGFVRGLSKNPMLVQFDKQEARHVSKTPNLERAQKRYKQNADRLPERMRVQVTAANKHVRPGQTPVEREISRRYGRNVTSEHLDQFELDNSDVTAVTYGRNNAVPSASGAAVSGQNTAVTPGSELPGGWDEKKLDMLPGFYLVFNSLDDTLKALQLSTSQKNRDFARNTLKQQGIWKEAK